MANIKKLNRYIMLLLISSFMLSTTFWCSAAPGLPPPDRELIYQIATYDSLSKGVYGGIVPLKVLTQHGDFGIGTFEGINGEMVVVDGVIYQVTVDGKVNAKRGNSLNQELTPYAVVTYFDTDIQGKLANLESFPALQEQVAKLLPNPDSFYAIRIDGTFAYIKTRSVPAQTKPYPVITEVIKQQAIFEYTNIQGSLIGFWCPQYVGGINVAGYHLHFVSADKSKGGHVLELKLKTGTVKIDNTSKFYFKLGK